MYIKTDSCIVQISSVSVYDINCHKFNFQNKNLNPETPVFRINIHVSNTLYRNLPIFSYQTKERRSPESEKKIEQLGTQVIEEAL